MREREAERGGVYVCVREEGSAGVRACAREKQIERDSVCEKEAATEGFTSGVTPYLSGALATPRERMCV